MKNLLITGFFSLLLFGTSCSGQPEQKQKIAAVSVKDVEVYYFHNTIRCATCLTIESEARKNIEMLYPDLYKEGKISFTSLNLEEATGRTMGEKLGVSGQTLLIVSGDQKINITTDGFLYAVAKPDKFKEVIKGKVDPLIKE
jgi:hypothetical protein